MLRDNYNVIIIPQRTSQVFRFQLSGVIIKLFMIFLSVFLLTTSYVGFSYYSMIKQKDEYYSLLNEARQQKISYRSLVLDLNRLNQNMKRQEKFDKKIRIVTYQKSSLSEFELKKTDSSETEKSLAQPLSSASLEILPKVNALKFDMSLRKVSFLQIIASIHENKDRLSRTPTIRPVKNGYLTSTYGFRIDPFTGSNKMHRGIDWAYYPFTPVFSPADGEVERIVKSISYGNMIIINHGYDVRTRYAHLSKVEVRRGQKIKRGDLIGRMGNTGLRSTATHLHYEILVRGNFVNPEQYILESLNPSSFN